MIEIPQASPDKIRLFIAYSRFEFALKEARFLTRDGNGLVRANWKMFAKLSCLNDVLDVAAANSDVQEMLAKPPKLQVMKDGMYWDWEDRWTRPIADLNTFFNAVKQVCDNLFHGGKAGEDPRDDLLCRAAWHVLELCLERHHEVRMAFEGKY
jgi:hypothetical protein